MKTWLSQKVGTREKILLMVLFNLLGFIFLFENRGYGAIFWMEIYRPEDFSTWKEFGDMLFHLRTGIPPVWASLDYLSWKLFDNLNFTEVYLYKFSFLFAFTTAILLTARTWVSIIPSLIIGLFWIWVISWVHPLNPMAYDAYFPMTLIAFGLFWTLAKKRNSSLFWLLAGLFLSLGELSRPYMIYLLPLVLLGIWWSLPKGGKRPFFLFLLPILLLSGTWHIKHLAQFGRVAWTNHTGFGLNRAWNFLLEEDPPLEAELPPLAEGRLPNIDSEIHEWNSEVFKKAILAEIIQHPFLSLNNGIKGVRLLMDGKTGMMGVSFDKPIAKFLYKISVWLVFSLNLLGVFVLIYSLLRKRKSLKSLLSNPLYMLNFILIGSILIMAISERGEYPRFLISLLPLLLLFQGRKEILSLRKSVLKRPEIKF